MCVVSMIGDYYGDRWPKKYPGLPWDQILPPGRAEPWKPYDDKVSPAQPSEKNITIDSTGKSTLDRLAAIEKEMAELKEEFKKVLELLEHAKKVDDETGEPDCEQDPKIAIFKALGQLLGIDVKDVFK